MSWDVRVLDEVARWLLALDDDTYDQVAAAIDLVAAEGPMLGRPLVDRISGSRIHNLKELRPGSAGQERDPDLVRVRSRTSGGPAGGR